MTAWIPVIGWTLIHFVWQGILVGLIAGVVLRLCHETSPGRRYVVACATLIVLAALPLATALWLSGGASGAPVVGGAGSVTAGAVRPVSVTPATSIGASLPPGPGIVDRVLPTVVWLWLMGVTVLLTHNAVGLWGVWRLQIEAAALPVSRWQGVGDRIGARLGLGRSVRVVESARVAVPTVLGWLRPFILLPFAVATRLTPSQLEAVLAHELAHVRRHDYPMNLVQVVVETILFYHPVVWWVSGRIRTEREHCCDDIAVATGGDAVDYASALVELNTLRATAGPMALAATGGVLGTRVRRLLRTPDEGPRRSGGSPVFVLALVVVAGLFVSASGRAGETGPFAVGGPMVQPSEPIALPDTFDWQTRSTEHVDVYFYPDLAPEVDDVVQAAEQAYAWVSGELAHELDFRVPVVLFKTRAEFERQEIAPGADLSGAYSFSEPRRNRLVLLVDEGRDLLADRITHEMTHIFMFDLVPRTGASATRIPAWIDEGLANHLMGAWSTVNQLQMRDLVAAGDLPTLTGADDIRERFGSYRAVFNVGQAAFDFIAATYGKDGIRRFVRALATSSDDPDTLYGTAFDITPAEFDRAYAAYLRARF